MLIPILMKKSVYFENTVSSVVVRHTTFYTSIYHRSKVQTWFWPKEDAPTFSADKSFEIIRQKYDLISVQILRTRETHLLVEWHRKVVVY